MPRKYNQIWKRVEKFLKIEFGSESVYGDNDKNIKNKLKIYGDSMVTNFQDKKMSKEKAPCKCLSIIMMLDFVIKAKKKYYAQTLLEKCKHEQEKVKMENLIDEDLAKGSIMILMMNQNLIMMNLKINLLKAKKSILITIKT